MAADRKDLEHYHNKGQEDCAEKRSYRTPRGEVLGDASDERGREQNEAYKKGWENARDQD